MQTARDEPTRRNRQQETAIWNVKNLRNERHNQTEQPERSARIVSTRKIQPLTLSGSTIVVGSGVRCGSGRRRQIGRSSSDRAFVFGLGVLRRIRCWLRIRRRLLCRRRHRRPRRCCRPRFCKLRGEHSLSQHRPTPKKFQMKGVPEPSKTSQSLP